MFTDLEELPEAAAVRSAVASARDAPRVSAIFPTAPAPGEIA